MIKRMILICCLLVLCCILLIFNDNVLNKVDYYKNKINTKTINDVKIVENKQYYYSDTLEILYSFKEISISELSIDNRSKNTFNLVIKYKENIDKLDKLLDKIKSIENFVRINSIIYTKNEEILIDLDFTK